MTKKKEKPPEIKPAEKPKSFQTPVKVAKPVKVDQPGYTEEMY